MASPSFLYGRNKIEYYTLFLKIINNDGILE